MTSGINRQKRLQLFATTPGVRLLKLPDNGQTADRSITKHPRSTIRS